MSKNDFSIKRYILKEENGERFFADAETGKRLRVSAKNPIGSLKDTVTSSAKGIKTALSQIMDDVKAVRERDPAAKSDAEVLLLYSGVHAMIGYRIAHKLYLSKRYFPARAISQFCRFLTGIEIHPGAEIGKGLFIDHGMGVVIGETTVIGDNCTIYQGVTLGGTGKDQGKRHPTLGNNIMIGAGAKVLGPLTVSDNSKIAAGAVVLADIPEHSTAVGVPAKVVRQRGERVVTDIDQINIPDPTAQQICALEHKIYKLRQELDEMKAEAEQNAKPSRKRSSKAKTNSEE